MVKPDLVALERYREAADAARDLNYAPYSGVLALAAAETAGGAVGGGSNIENANFTLTKHAEEVAIITAFRQSGERPSQAGLAAVYIAGPPPCGGCRQFASEFGVDDAVWIFEPVDQAELRTTRLVDLPRDRRIHVLSFAKALPVTFNGEGLLR